MYYIHINRNTIDSNRKNSTNNPPIRYQKGKYGKAVYAHEVAFRDGRIIYDHEGFLLPCGARLVIVTDEEPSIVR